MTVARCNPYGAENPGGHPVALGGFIGNFVLTTLTICEHPAEHRYRWVCEHGHQGPIVHLCERHWAEFMGRDRYRDEHGRTQEMPWNIRRDVRVCPTCMTQAPTPEEQHKCKVRLVTVS
jgi:hypothetical protein